MNRLGGIFRRGYTLDRMKIQELQYEQARLEAQERTVTRRLRALAARSGKLFADSTTSGGNIAEDRIAARQISVIMSEQNDLESDAENISRKIVTVGRLVRYKERQKALEDNGLWVQIGSIPIEVLEDSLNNATAGNEHLRRQLEAIDERLGADAQTVRQDESPQIADIMKHMEAARESGNVEEELDVMESKRRAWEYSNEI